MFFLILILIAFNSAILPQSGQATVTGKVINSADKNPLANCNISIKENPVTEKQFSTGTVTDPSGNFKVSLPPGNYILNASYVGYETYEERFTILRKDYSS